MSPTWRSPQPPPAGPIGAAGWARAIPRAVALFGLIHGGLAVMLLLRLLERPVFGRDRPVTPWITLVVCRGALAIIGMRRRVHGRPMRRRGAIVANHVSWLDIFALNAAQRVYFVAKSEVAGWPVIGWLARATGTVFITRTGRDARDQAALLAARLGAGHRLAIFPEGTSTDGLRVLGFKTALFEALCSAAAQDSALHVQPVSVIYHAPAGADARFYGWWGDMGFARHFLRVLAARRQGCVALVFHAPVAVAAVGGRKALAAQCEAAVRAGLAEARAARP